MSEATKKLIEIGAIPDQTLRLAQSWEGLPPSVPTPPTHPQSTEKLIKLVDELAELQDAESTREIPVVDLDLNVFYRDNAKLVTVINKGPLQTLSITLLSVRTPLGQFVFKGDLSRIVCLGCVIEADKSYVVADIEWRRAADNTLYAVCTVEPASASDLMSRPDVQLLDM